ncbi:hypothetical protein H6F90_04865 [Trichocoleus sp. FACHB-591]|uniref:hypothetical protein n=1 Tax=Trichocoleus sp. FACHB-591 TaxID=2692872 RepID=UPI001686962A|nr:hypothetical protein [Trichocoleus sp. FACHB-591]MBD2094481.1 hypothetical protein [Trichocoleus sp. FACHB-591]
MPFDWETFNYDQNWLQEAIQLEAASEQDVQIGGVRTSRPLSINPTQLQDQLKRVKLLSILFGELRHLLERANLGAGTEAALAQGRQSIQARVAQLSSEQQKYLEALLAEEESNPAEKPLRLQLNPMLCSLLTESDWQEIAQAAMNSIQTRLLEQVIVRQSA